MANTAPLDLAQYDYAADQIEVALKRAYPSELEKEELADVCHLNPDEMRAGLEILRNRGGLNENGEQFAWRDPADPPEAAPIPAGAVEPGEDAGEEPEEEEPKPAGGLADQDAVAYKATYQLGMKFSATDAEAALQVASSLEPEVADALADALATRVEVELSRVQAFDQPRDVPLPGERVEKNN